MYTSFKSPHARSPVTVPHLHELKARREKIVVLTAYDASFAAQCDAAGVDVVLVGDSLGMVVQGRASTLPVTLDEVIYHTAAVARGLLGVVARRLPFMTYRDADPGCAPPRLLAEAGAAMVKVEGAGYVLVSSARQHDIPCAHLGLTPQSVHKFGGYRVQGKSKSAAERLIADAHAVQDAGADLVVLECVPAALAGRITEELRIPTIGIGAGVDCDGQVLVLYDMLGITHGRRPRFSKDFLNGQESVAAAIKAYAHAVRAGEFPSSAHAF
jgi:3-methyl-2-oxobutanoate hydroxymethyltransferase